MNSYSKSFSKPALCLAVSLALASPLAVAQDAPTVEDAAEFIAEVEQWSREYGEYAARVAWAQATNITYDTNWLATKSSAEATRKGVEFANQAKVFNDLELPAVMRRKIEKIKLGVNIPAPTTEGAAGDLERRYGAPARISRPGRLGPRRQVSLYLGCGCQEPANAGVVGPGTGERDRRTP